MKNMSVVLLLIFSLVGLVDTLYLGYHTLAGTDVACPFFPDEWCAKVQYSPYSRTLGIPNSFAGLGMYTLILVLLWLHGRNRAPFWALQAVVGFGFLFSMYFTYVQAFVLQAFCTWCVVSAVNFTVMAVAAFPLPRYRTV